MPEEKVDYEKEIQTDLEINEDNLPEELVNQSSDMFYWGSMWARAAKARRKSKLELDILDASLSKEFREIMLKTNPEVRVTERMLNEYLNGHPKMQEGHQKFINASYLEDMFGVANTAFKQRGQVLLELAKSNAENKFYENELRTMREDFERKEEKKIKKMKEKNKENENG